jgi:hypothetical protein
MVIFWINDPSKPDIVKINSGYPHLVSFSIGVLHSHFAGNFPKFFNNSWRFGKGLMASSSIENDGTKVIQR